MNDNSAYNYAKDKLLEFIKLSGIKTIIFHQFEFLIMYFPLYMIIHDLMEVLDELNIRVEFKSEEKDEKIIEHMSKESFESFEMDSEKNILHIGLCEPVVFNDKKHTRKIKFPGYKYLDNLDKNEHKYKLKNECLRKISEKDKVSYFMHLPFINFPPIYGISSSDNTSIQNIKQEKQKEGGQKASVWLSIDHYWRHFYAKLSLLDKDDFKSLVTSSYPDGSTTDWFIREEIKFPFSKTPISIEHLNKEFDALFEEDKDKKVDVAFTVQPWVAISDSVCSKPPYEIDIVYKDVCKKFDCTSLIFKTNKDEYLILGDYILNCFKILLEKKIEDIYKMSSDELRENIERYCLILHKHTSLALDEGFKFENKMALRLTIDSQIYRELQDTEIKSIIELIDEKKVFSDYFVTKYGDSTEGIDLFEKLIINTCKD